MDARVRWTVIVVSGVLLAVQAALFATAVAFPALLATHDPYALHLSAELAQVDERALLEPSECRVGKGRMQHLIGENGECRQQRKEREQRHDDRHLREQPDREAHRDHNKRRPG